MSSIALALKYRPTLFNDLVGQNAISQTLSLALDSKHISHAYLFSGLRGSGKTSSARIFARALQCESGPTSTPCGECPNCTAALQGNHMDIIEMDAASSRGIDDIKRLIEQTKYHPSLGRYKIFIIDEVHMLSKEAFNALLKTLEEPPEFVKFILATTDPLKLPATILSRTQHFRFKQIPHKLVVEHMSNILDKEQVSYEPQALDIIARSGAGSLRDTLTLLDQAIIFCKNHIEVTAVSDMLGIVDPEVLQKYFYHILHKQDQETQAILETLFEYECEMILDEMMLFLKDKLLQRDSAFPPLLLDRFAYILTESKTLLNLNTDGNFVLLLCTLKMQEAMKIKDIQSMIEELENEVFSAQTKQPPLSQAGTLAPIHGTAQAISQTPSQIPSQSPSKDSTQPPAQASSQSPAQIPAQESQSTALNAKIRFSHLITKIKDRNAHLGAVFEANVSFIDFIDLSHTLRWQSVAQGADKELLKEHGKIIYSLVKSIFGQEVHIEQVSQNPQATPNPPIAKQETQESPMQKSDDKQQFLAQNKDLIMAIEQSIGIKEVRERNSHE